MELKGKHILIGVTGSIAAYKIPYLIRLFIKAGAEVKVVMTSSATDFVTPLTLSTLSTHPVGTVSHNPTDGSWNNHIEYGEWADLFLIAPASANTLAKIAHGHADNLLTCIYLAARCPVFLAPAMDLDMYKHAATQANISILKKRGNHIIDPTSGPLASGLCGAGRLEEPENILSQISSFFFEKLSLKGVRVLITAGPTFEPIDAVRFVGNFSSGKMGYTLAAEAARRGAEVILISGPVSLETPSSVSQRINVTTADEMLQACNAELENSDIVIGVAAVADFTPKVQTGVKLSKKGSVGEPAFAVELFHTTDILAHLAHKRSAGQTFVGFALETDNLIEKSQAKMRRKKLDMIVANSALSSETGFNSDTNRVSIIHSDGEVVNSELLPKSAISYLIINEIERFRNK